MAMSSFSDSSSFTQVTGRRTGSGRLNYVPPHLRDNNASTPFYGPTPRPPFRYPPNHPRNRQHPGPTPNRYSVDSQQLLNPTHTHLSNPFDVIDKLDDLTIAVEHTQTQAPAAINFDAYEDIPVEATGTDIPKPATSFADIDLGDALNENIRRCRYVKPTPIQRHAIPVAMAGRDLMACAQTGSGKTAAFCFPIISGIVKAKRSTSQMGSGRGGSVAFPLALILSPTRELSCQIHEEAKKFSDHTEVKVVVVYGGAPMFEQLRNLERGVDILVATPGRLVDMIERLRISLRMIKYLALDEADRMLDMGFEQQIRKIVQQMDMPPPGARQTMLFSATFPSDIQRLAADFLSNYVFLSVGRVGSSTDLIVQKVELVPNTEKRNYLMNILCKQSAIGINGKNALTLVFVETKRGADSLERWLCKTGFSATAIHGDKVQFERERALRSFKSGATPIMVATDVASRGLDIPHVAHVINYDLPRNIDDYVHRIGRTGRAGKSGLATAFFSDSTNLSIAKPLAELMQEAKQKVPSWLSEYAEKSDEYDSGRTHPYGGGRFGGRDFRSADSNFSGVSNDFSDAFAVDSDFSATTNSDYCAAPAADVGTHYYAGDTHGYGYEQEPIVASGWD